MSVPLPPGFLPHTAVVRPKTGQTGMGPTYGAPVTIACMTEDGARLVRNATGAEVVSSARVACSFDVIAPPGSLVTIWPGTPRAREAQVITTAGAPHPILPSHQTLALT